MKERTDHLARATLRVLEYAGYSTLVDWILNYRGRGYNSSTNLSFTINSSLVWNSTPQGRHFWECVSIGNFEDADIYAPDWSYLLVNDKDLAPKNEVYKVELGGLFKTMK